MPTEWLRIMLEEIERRRDDARRAREEEEKRLSERDPRSMQKQPIAPAAR